ncbi:MAG TPA: SHOCT domain-containing protein [Woeseiaceae bacterium]|nr:SHOCT domain-containing protein [Woeseiaceae bacterium]
MHDWIGVEHMAGMWLWWVMGIAIVAGIVWAVLRSSPGASGDAGSSAEELLKRRYAQGDIDQDEYERRLRDLRQ